MLDWIKANDTLLWWLAASSVVMFVGTLIVVPILIVRLPADYFTDARRHRTPWAEHHPVIRVLLITGKNLLGAVFVLVGIAMLLTPGQGLLTLVIGLVLVDFPGKYRLERWLVSRRPVHRTIDWLRRRAGREPMM